MKNNAHSIAEDTCRCRIDKGGDEGWIIKKGVDLNFKSTPL